MDWVEGATAWLLIFGGLVGSGVALMIGLSAYESVAERARVEAASRAPVAAVLIEDAPAVPDPQARGSYPVTAQVRWTGADGVERVGETLVRGEHSAGETVTVWLGRNNDLLPAPTSTSEAVLAAFVSSFLALGVVAAVLAAAWGGVRGWTFTRDCAGWEREWLTVEPIWSGQIRGSR
jgi:hypothetical protein